MLKVCLFFMLIASMPLVGCSKNDTTNSASSYNTSTTPSSQSVETEEQKTLAEEGERLRTENVAREQATQPNKVSTPFEFKGIQLGQPIQDVKKKFNRGLATINRPPFKILGCTNREKFNCKNVSNLTLIGHTLNSAQFWLSKSNRLVLIWAKIDEQYFDDLLTALTGKYGDPTKIDKTSLVNKLSGVESNYIEATWQNTDGLSVMVLANHIIDGSTYSPEAQLIIQNNEVETQRNEYNNKMGIKPDSQDL